MLKSKEESLIIKIKNLVESEVRPMIVGDGGDIEVGELSADGILELKIQGNCVHCASLPMTLTFGIEEKLKEKFPEVKGITLL